MARKCSSMKRVFFVDGFVARGICREENGKSNLKVCNFWVI